MCTVMVKLIVPVPPLMHGDENIRQMIDSSFCRVDLSHELEIRTSLHVPHTIFIEVIRWKSQSSRIPQKQLICSAN